MNSDRKLLWKTRDSEIISEDKKKIDLTKSVKPFSVTSKFQNKNFWRKKCSFQKGAQKMYQSVHSWEAPSRILIIWTIFEYRFLENSSQTSELFLKSYRFGLKTTCSFSSSLLKFFEMLSQDRFQSKTGRLLVLIRALKKFERWKQVFFVYFSLSKKWKREAKNYFNPIILF